MDFFEQNVKNSIAADKISDSLEKCVADEQAIAEASNVRIRYRPPFIGTSMFDARGDAIYLVLEQLTGLGLPYAQALTVASSFINDAKIGEHLHTSVKNLDVGSVFARRYDQIDDYLSIDASVWCRKVVAELKEYIAKIQTHNVEINAPQLDLFFPFGMVCRRNRRMKNEDKILCVPNAEFFGYKDCKYALFAVFDGHGGVDVARTAAAQLPSCMYRFRHEDFTTGFQRAIKLHEQKIATRVEKEHYKGGATAIIAGINDKTIEIAWAGDSVAAMVYQDKVVMLNSLHNPQNAEERARVEAAGGMVVHVNGADRVNGVLTVTRALGDLGGRPMISGDCEFKTIDRSQDDGLALILMSDGIWDAIQEIQLFDLFKKYVTENPNFQELGLDNFPIFLADEAASMGSDDNQSVVIVYLTNPKHIAEKLISP